MLLLKENGEENCFAPKSKWDWQECVACPNSNRISNIEPLRIKIFFGEKDWRRLSVRLIFMKHSLRFKNQVKIWDFTY